MSRPRELYLFQEEANPTLFWTYTSADSKVVYMLNEFLPIPIGRDEIESKNELSKSNITVTVSLDEPMARRWLLSSTDALVRLTIFSADIELDPGTVAPIIWKGRLASIKPTDKSIQLFFESVFTSLRRPGLRRKYQRNCSHVLYGNQCKVPKGNYAIAAVVEAVNGVSLIIPDASLSASDWFTFGMIEWNNVARFITKHNGNNIILVRPLEGLTIGQTVKIYPGCNRTIYHCQDKFNNILNNGSFPFIPLINPFGGKSIV